jgi:hypothetical protein
MKKIILSLLFLCSGALAASAQLLPSVQFGLKAGANFSNLKEVSVSSETRTGFLGGVWARVGAAGFHFQPELYFSSKGSEGDQGTSKFTTLDLPLLLGTRIGVGPLAARVQVGPVVSFVLDEENSLGDALGDVTEFNEYKNQQFALTGGIGADISKLRADLRYEHGLSDVYSGNGDNNGKLKLWTLSIGYRLF